MMEDTGWPGCAACRALNPADVESASIESLPLPRNRHFERNQPVCQTFTNKLHKNADLFHAYYGDGQEAHRRLMKRAVFQE
jgi:hypothetical protein